MAFEHLTFFEVHVHPGTDESPPEQMTSDGADRSAETPKTGSKRRTILGLVTASLVVSVIASVAAKRLGARFADTEAPDGSTGDSEIEIVE